MKTDVIIAGAGPTGLALAIQLARYGVDFVIFDKKETTTPFSKAIGVQARTLEIYEQIGLAGDMVEMGTITERARLVEGGEVRAEIELTNFGTGMSAYPFLLIVEQGRHEKLLYDYLGSQEKDVLWNTELLKFEQDEAGVKATVQNADGKTEEIEAKYLVGCDGAKSLVRHTLGMNFPGTTFERFFYVADVEIDWEFSHDALHVCLARTTITAFFPMPGGKNRYRIVGTFPEGYQGDEGEVLYEEIEKQINADTEMKLDVTKVNWFSVYKVHARHADRFRKGRCFLAGDSAHIHSPAGAQGMNTGIQDAYNLAWKLAAVLKAGATEDILETYNDERVANAHRLLKTTDRIFNLGASSEPVTAFLRLHVVPYIANFLLGLDVVQKSLFPLISQIGINYHDSDLSVDEGGFDVKAGDRMPYFVIDGESIYDRLREPKFHLVAFADGKTELADMTEELSAAYPNLIDVHTVPLYPNIAESFGAKESFMALLRPDNYIGLISGEVSLEKAAGYMEKVLGRETTGEPAAAE
jgi:2-polyprenyl-6-methoxyphenol hydroxylase-like FAD-dependent oxidoreductase